MKKPKEQLSFEQARLKRDLNLQRVEVNADPDWKAQALEAVRQTCLDRYEFICDDVWEIGNLDSTREDRALGPVMLKAKKLGYCEKTDRTRPSRRSNLSGKPVWRSRLWK